ncbi:MAG: DUF456 domain-containing protein [Bacteroidales bacterium]|nr:DUF456 domain-containing protein [Bacteroidales bacterium]
MDIVLLVLGIILMLVGILGCILPVLPGPPLSFGGLLLLHFTKFAEYTTTLLIILAIVAVAVTILDYFVPIWGTKRFGGTKYGSRGAMVGVVLGIFLFPPIGIIIFPFIGAVVGESLQGADFNAAMRAGFGSFMGFLTGTGLKLIASLIMAYYFVTAWLG